MLQNVLLRCLRRRLAARRLALMAGLLEQSAELRRLPARVACLVYPVGLEALAGRFQGSLALQVSKRRLELPGSRPGLAWLCGALRIRWG